jgi:N-acetylglutamate synthase-like GNAT family acetyltransferase
MTIRLLNKKTELETVNGWLPYVVTHDQLPGHTFCAVVKGKLVAMAALRLMEGDVCFIDSMATDPKVEGKIRHEALDKLTDTILELGKNLGFKRIFATTKEECIVERAKRHGFKLSNEQVIVRDLT